MKKGDSQKEGHSAESLKADLKRKLMDLIQHPGTPRDDKDKLVVIVNELEGQ